MARTSRSRRPAGRLDSLPAPSSEAGSAPGSISGPKSRTGLGSEGGAGLSASAFSRIGISIGISAVRPLRRRGQPRRPGEAGLRLRLQRGWLPHRPGLQRRGLLLGLPLQGVGRKQDGKLAQCYRLFGGVNNCFQFGFQAHSRIGTSIMVPDAVDACERGGDGG